MAQKLKDYKKFIFFSIILISLGVTFTNTIDDVPSLGVVFIAIGGLFFIIGMSKKKKADNKSSD
ncbi:MAG: hypothetical protein C0598_03520 [Marinilabiliales bacterium]|nr:MAG: hypothetical protein C0598_03520 [Marinilabiliales bacterium]